MSTGSVLPVNVYTDQDFYVPSFRVIVRSKELRAELNDVMSVSYSDSLTSIDSFDMTVNNWDAETLSFKYSDGSLFTPWQDVELWMGYLRDGKEERRRMLVGEITTMTPNFPASGGPTLTVRALNLFHRFRIKQESQAFFNQTDTAIAEVLVGRIADQIRKTSPKVHLVLDPADVKRNKKLEKNNPVPYLIMNNQYPILFLMERARRIGYDLTMDEVAVGESREVTFHFRPSSAVTRKTYALEWGVSLISFQPTFRTADQVAKVTVRGWDPKAKKPIEQSAVREDLKDEHVIDPDMLGVNEPQLAQQVTVDEPVSSAVEAKEYAKKILRQKASVMVTAKGKTVGLPDLRAGVKVAIGNLGRFSGVYLVTETTHSLGDGGYTTDFTARMEGSVG
jgi:phage protein D